MIEVNNLTFAFKGRSPTFENISFSLPEGEILCILWEKPRCLKR